MRETLSDVLDGRWFIASFDDQTYLRDIMSEEEFNAFKNDCIGPLRRHPEHHRRARQQT